MRLVVFLVYFMAFLGIAMPYPVITPLFMNGGIASPFAPETALGLALAVYPIGLFFGGGTLGSFSDKLGRRPVLMFSLSVTMVCTVWSGIAIWQGDFFQFVISRFVTGYFEASGSIARAMLVDVEKGESKASSFAFLSVGAYAGYLVGPVMAGYLAVFNNALPFFVAGIMGFVALLLAAMWLPETNNSAAGRKTIRHRPKILHMLRDHGVFRQVLLAHFLLTMGVNTFYQFYPLLLVKKWALGSFDIALSNIFFTGSMIFFAIVGVKRLEKVMTLGPKLLLGGVLVALLMALNLVAFSLEASLMIAALLGFAVAIVNAALPAFMSRHTVKDLEQGAVMGSLTSSFCLAQAGISVLGSQLAMHSVDYTFLLGSVAALAGVAQVYAIRRRKGKYRLAE